MASYTKSLALIYVFLEALTALAAFFLASIHDWSGVILFSFSFIIQINLHSIAAHSSHTK